MKRTAGGGAGSIRLRLLFAIGVLTVPLLAMLAAGIALWSANMIADAEKITAVQAKQLSAHLGESIGEVERTLRFLRDDRSVDWLDRGSVDRRLGAYIGHMKFSRGVNLFDPTGSLVAPSENAKSGVKASDRSWFRRALAEDGLVVDKLIVSRLTGNPIIPLAMPLQNGGRTVGILTSSVDLEAFRQEVGGFSAAGWVVTLIAADGEILLRFPDPGRFVGKRELGSPLIDGIVGGQAPAGVFVGLDGVRRVYATDPVRVDGKTIATVAAGLSVDGVLSEANKVQRAAWALFALVVGAGLAAAAAGMRSAVARPLAAINGRIAKIAGGDFTGRIDTAALPKELAAVAEAVNTMARSLTERDAALADYRTNLEAKVAERTRDLERAQAELIRSNGELQQFAYVASHDLQEPLRMVASFTQLLSQKYAGSLDEQARKYIAFAVDGAVRMQGLITDLLTYSRIETQAKELVAVSSAECLRNALDNLKLFIEEHGALVESGELPPVTADPGQLTQLFQNLVLNGIKFNRSDRPTVSVSAEAREGGHVFAVRDNGIGIAPEFGERVYVIFQRLNPRSEFPGTGIGLAVCKRIVGRHGGRIWHEPAAGGGTRFCFTLAPGVAPPAEGGET